MNNRPLPQELSRFQTLPDLTFRGSDEWSSACPHCGGADRSRRDKSDRFRLFDANNGHDARAWCRNCGHFEWATENSVKPSKDEIEKANKERTRLAEIDRKRVKSKIVELQKAAYWQGWHDAMHEIHRELWHKEGIIDWAIDRYKLGYCPDHKTRHNGDEWITPTMTIPHWGPGWELVNIQHRLLNPPKANDKYRQTAGIPASMFLTEPDEKLTGSVLIVEGAKKAIVTYIQLGMDSTGEPTLVIAVPSKTPSRMMLDQLKDCDPIYLMLDPDAYYSSSGSPAVNRVATKLGRSRVRAVKLPVKPDDFFTVYGGSKSDMLPFIRQAVKA